MRVVKQPLVAEGYKLEGGGEGVTRGVLVVEGEEGGGEGGGGGGWPLSMQGVLEYVVEEVCVSFFFFFFFFAFINLVLFL